MVLTIVLSPIAPPTAVPLFGSVKETSSSERSVTALDWLSQLFPPSVVLRMVPKEPTVVPLFASVKETPTRLLVPIIWLAHMYPPSVDRRMVPPSSAAVPPTAVALFASAKETPQRKLVVPLLR